MAFNSFATNIALNKTATASSIQGSGLEASKAVDGNTGTRWSSAATNGEWMYVDLGSSNYIDTVKLRWENAYGLDYKIQFSGDASQWTDAAHITNGAYEYRAIPTGHAIARYVKMQGITRGTGYGYSIWEFEVIGTCVPPNNNPTNITLSNSSVNENLAAGTVVGTLTTTDPDAGNTFTYSLVSGTGSTDNASFTLDAASLKTASSFNYEAKSSYSIRLRTTDNYAGTFEKQFTISVNNVNEAPTDISLSSTNVVEKQPVGTVVGTLSTTDPDAGSTFTYSLVAGTGDADNASFTIDGSSLKTASVFNYATKSSYSIRVKTVDNGTLSFEKQFTITVKEQNIALGKTTTCSSQEGALASGQAVDGSLASRWGSGWSDNEWIKVDLSNSYAVYKVILRWENAYGKDYKIQTSQDGTTWTDAATITNAPKEDRIITFSPAVTCRYIKMQGIHRGTGWGYSLWEFEVHGNSIPNAAPTDISLSNSTVFQGDAIGTVVGTFTATDPNYGDVFTYSLVSGTGGDDNSSFSINGAQLKTNVVFNSSSKPTYSIRVKTADNGQLFYEKQFSVQVLSTADINYPLGMYAIYSTEQVTICQNSTVNSGMVGSNAGIDMGDNSHVTDNVIAGTTLVLHDNSRIDKNAFAGGTITKYSNVTVGGMTRQNTSHQALAIQQKTVTPGTQNITVAGSSTLNLAPGSYNNFMALVYSKVQLSPGVYNFRSFMTEPDVQIECLMEATDVIEVNVLENIDLRDRAKVYATGTTQASARSIQFYSNQTVVVNVHPYDNIYAMITTPNAELHIHPYTQFSGIAYGKRVYIEPNVSFDGSSSYLVDSDGDGVQDIIENDLRYRTNPGLIISYPFIALVKKPVLAEPDKEQKVTYDFSAFFPDYTNCQAIVLTVPPNTIGQNEIPPMVEMGYTKKNGQVPVLQDPVKQYELIGKVYKISGSLLPSKSLSFPLPIPVNGDAGVGASMVVVHYNDDGTVKEYCNIDSVTSNAVYVHLESFSDIALFALLNTTSANAYVDDKSVYRYDATPELPELNFKIRILNSQSAPQQASIEINYLVPDITWPGGIREKTITAYFNCFLSFYPDYSTGKLINKINSVLEYKNIIRPEYEWVKLKSVKILSTADGMEHLGAPVGMEIEQETDIGKVEEKGVGYVTAKIDARMYNPDHSGDQKMISFIKTKTMRLDYYPISSAYGIEGRQEYDRTNATGYDDYHHYYYVKDHLGSTRMTINADDAAFNATEATMYESYGAMEPVASFSPVNSTKEKFTGKEFDEEGKSNGGTGIGMFYFGARNYDPEIGMFTAPDPARQFWNSYAYGYGNPICGFDPNGNDWYNFGGGDLVWVDGSDPIFDPEGGGSYYSLGSDLVRAVGGNTEGINAARFEIYLSSNTSGPSAIGIGNTVPTGSLLPADQRSFATISPGLYPITLTEYHGEPALLINNGGPVPIEGTNPNITSGNYGQPYATGVYIHSGGRGNSLWSYRTGGTPISTACQTIWTGSLESYRGFMNQIPANFSGNYYLQRR
jgi:RHS repeat-associated protein